MADSSWVKETTTHEESLWCLAYELTLHQSRGLFADARDIINLWEEILENHAYRCVSNNITDLEGISQITEEDITL